MELLPICYVKPTILCLDDDIQFTAMLTEYLHNCPNKNYKLVCFNRSKDLLAYLSKYQSVFEQEKIFRNFSESEFGDLPTSSLIQIDLHKIQTIINRINSNGDAQKPNSTTSFEIAAVIIDYLMPDIDGVQLCQQLKHYNFKKVLYTAIDDYKVGINAMNENIIDNFISKSDEPSILVKKIENCIYQYFYDQTLPIIKYLAVDNILPLTDPLFCSYIKQLIADYDIVKYCLINKTGDLWMVSADNTQYVLIVHTDDSINNFLKLIADEPELKEISLLIKNKQKIPYIPVSNLNDENYLDLSSIKLYIPNILVGRGNYYLYFLKK